ncbi:hypothetical protein ACFL4F_00305 [Candidatus Margulisiibacteriota bacterium]
MNIDKKYLYIIAFALIFLVVLVFYYSSLGLGFLYSDDFGLIKSALNSPSSYFLGNWMGERGVGGFYRPIIVLSAKIDNLIWGINPFGYHLTNGMFHFINAFLVFLIAYFVLGNYLFALFSGALFAILPVNAEAVNWICCRGDVMATTFFLSAFYGYLIFVKKKAKWALFASFALFVLALGSKETAVALPIMIAAYAYLNKNFTKQIGVIISYFSVLILYLILRYFSLGSLVRAYEFSSRDMIMRLILGPIKTIQLIFLPFRQENLIAYLIIMLLLILSLVLLIIWVAKRYKPHSFYFFSLFWVLIALLPASTILPIGFDLRGSRMWYLPSVGVSWFLSYVIFIEMWKEKRAIKLMGIGLFLLFWLYSSFFLIKANENWAKASRMSEGVKQKVINIINKYPSGTRFYFCNMPDNYNGCSVGLPYLEEPFYETDHYIRGYKGNYYFIDDLSKHEVRKGFQYFVYNDKTSEFDPSTYEFISSNKISRLNDNQYSRNMFKAYMKRVFGK